MPARPIGRRRRRGAASRSWPRRFWSPGAPSRCCRRSWGARAASSSPSPPRPRSWPWSAAIDDLRPLPAGARLALQCLAVGIVIAALPGELRIVPQAPWWIERACLLLGGVWLVNLVNFMDGIDWMTVAEVVPVTGAIVLLGISGAIGMLPALVAAVLLGAILGFAPFNKPVAQLFLGDVGSLPIGLLLGWLLLPACRPGPSGRRAHPAALLSRRHHPHARAPHRKRRAVLAGASHAFLSARDRQRLQRARDR